MLHVTLLHEMVHKKSTYLSALQIEESEERYLSSTQKILHPTGGGFKSYRRKIRLHFGVVKTKNKYILYIKNRCGNLQNAEKFCIFVM